MDLIPVNMEKRDRPKQFIDKALEIFKQQNGNIIVEIGCMRQPLSHNLDDSICPSCQDGHSSVLFARTGAEFYSCDIDANSIKLTESYCTQYPKAKITCIDGIIFLDNLDKTFKIDLLYLDGWDVGLTDCAEKHLEAFKHAESHMNTNSLILIDDTDLYWDFEKKTYFPDNLGMSGKGKLLIPYLLNNSYKLIFTGRQTLLKKAT